MAATIKTDMLQLYLSHEANCTRVLGPGLRYAVWTQGCMKRCPGCIFPEGRELAANGYYMEVTELAEKILANAANLTGLTISGGEPFLQAEPLLQMLQIIRENSKLDVMIYSGYALQELQAKKDIHINGILELTDMLVDGEYLQDLDYGQMYRGSENQQIHFLSDKYRPYKDKILNTKNRNIELVYKNSNLFMIGLPKKDFLQKFIKAAYMQEVK